MSDRWFGGAIVILSLLFLTIAVPSISDDWQTGPGARYFTVGPRLFPYIAGGLTLLFGALIALTADGSTRQQFFQTSEGRKNVLLAIAIAFLFAATLSSLGFVLAGVLALLAFLIVFGERRPRIIIPIAIGVPLLVHAIFLKAFALELPVGLLPLPF